jgi:hypothetical protein
MQLLQRRQMVRDKEANGFQFCHFPEFSKLHPQVREEEFAISNQVLLKAYLP